MTRDRTEFARVLRRRQTLAERTLWKAVRDKRLDGLKFRRQYGISHYFADFACESLMLVVELDGAVHDEDDNQLNDHVRQQEIEAHGWACCDFAMKR